MSIGVHAFPTWGAPVLLGVATCEAPIVGNQEETARNSNSICIHLSTVYTHIYIYIYTYIRMHIHISMLDIVDYFISLYLPENVP